MDIWIECALFIAGLVFGSFLNVCISRIPRDQSILVPGSQCPSCGAAIRWYDNIPVISFFSLRRRCRDCGEPISWRYPAVELLTAVLFLACYQAFGAGWNALKFAVFCFLLVGLIFMDCETGMLPREFTYTGIVLGLGIARLVPTDSAATQFLLHLWKPDTTLSARQLSLLDSLLGALVGAAFFYLAWALYYMVRHRHGLGFGDIALMGMTGAFLGLKLAVLVIFAAPIVATLYASTLFFFGQRHSRVDAVPSGVEPFLARELPFGVFLGSCSLLAAFFGESVWSWYLSLF